MARIKKVFSSQAQLAHIWAQQTQSEGRTSNMFFRDTEIFSYGNHYLAADIHTTSDGKKFAIVNSYNYSNSTAKHLSRIRSALRGLMPYFHGSNPNDPTKTLAEMIEAEKQFWAETLRVKKVSRQSDIDWKIERIVEFRDELNQLRKLLGLETQYLFDHELVPIRLYLHKRLERYHELNTPEMIAKKKVEREKREARAEKSKQEKQKELIEKFRKGESVGYIDLAYELLRVQGNEVVTSRGARVPLIQAKTALLSILGNQDILGSRIGSFQIDRIDEIQDDKVIKIGCHRILLKEAVNVLLKEAV
jgi:hypothetical protein